MPTDELRQRLRTLVADNATYASAPTVAAIRRRGRRRRLRQGAGIMVLVAAFTAALGTLGELRQQPGRPDQRPAPAATQPGPAPSPNGLGLAPVVRRLDRPIAGAYDKTRADPPRPGETPKVSGREVFGRLLTNRSEDTARARAAASVSPNPVELLLVRDWSVGAGPWPRLAWYVVITGYACDARDGSPLIHGKPFPPPLDARPVTASTCDTYSVIDADANERAGDVATVGAVGNYASPSPANLFRPRHPS
jgi:hypothetical protein